jgi:ADP-heptose:LPS heptosyltransferase
MSQFIKEHSPHLFILGSGAIGDNISAIPAIRYAAENIFDLRKFRVMIPPTLRFLFDFLPEENIFYIGKEDQRVTTEWVVIRHYDLIPSTLHISAILSPMRMPLVDYASIKFLNMILRKEDKDYPKPNLNHVDISKFNLPEKYACILVTNLNKNRSLPFKTSEKIAKHLIKKGITPVYLGRNTKIVDTFNQTQTESESPLGFPGVIDLVDKTSLEEVTKIMGGSHVVIGADTGLIHLAACTDARIICGYTTVSPELRIPQRNYVDNWNFIPIAPPASSCRFCASELHRYDVNFNKCKRIDLQCVSTTLNPERFIKAIDSLDCEYREYK